MIRLIPRRGLPSSDEAASAAEEIALGPSQKKKKKKGKRELACKKRNLEVKLFLSCCSALKVGTKTQSRMQRLGPPCDTGAIVSVYVVGGRVHRKYGGGPNFVTSLSPDLVIVTVH
jgi:hypothetical protein